MTSFCPSRRQSLLALSALGTLSFSSSPSWAKAPSTSSGTSTTSSNTPKSLEHLQHRAFQGGVALVRLGPLSSAPQAYFKDQRVLVLRPHQSSDWWAIVGIALSTEPGTHTLVVKEGQTTKPFPFQVSAKSYPKQHITLKDNKYVSPPEQTQRRIQEELKRQTEAYKVWSALTPSNLLFDPPAPGRMSSPFGFQRIFNGEPRNPHSGLDFAAPTGTPVKTPADGKILLIGDFFFNGKTVFVDHGMGLISMFCHLSSIDRAVGDSVKRGEIVAKVGNTGRSTGPHLHWNVSLNNARVDPALFLRKTSKKG